MKALIALKALVTFSPVSTSLRSRPDLLLMMVFVSSKDHRWPVRIRMWSLEIPGAVLWLVGHNLRKKHVLHRCSGLHGTPWGHGQQQFTSSYCSKRYQRYQRYQAMPWPYCSSGGRPRKPHRSRRKLSDDPCIESTESKTTRRPENTQKQILPWLRIGYTLATHWLRTSFTLQDRVLLPSRGHWEPLTAGQSQPRTKHSQENALTYSDMLSISIYDLDLRSFCNPSVLSCWYFSEVVPTVLVRCPKFIESAWSKGGQWMALASGQPRGHAATRPTGFETHLNHSNHSGSWWSWFIGLV